MSKLIIEHAVVADTVLVRCSKCGKKFLKVPADRVLGKPFKYCPLCGCRIEAEGYSGE